MDVSHLVRNADEVKKRLKKTNGVLYATKPVKIMVPEAYMGAGLGSVDGHVSILATYFISDGERHYGVSKACALMNTEPSITTLVDIGSEKYYEFTYNAGDKVVSNVNLICTKTLVYRIYNYFIAKGKVPWFMSYDDMCFLLDTSLIHANVNLRADSALLELIAAVMARQKVDKMKFFRHDPKLAEPHYDAKPVFMPLKSVAFGVSGTTAKLAGNYFSEAVTSALVYPSEKVEAIEEILRK